MIDLNYLSTLAAHNLSVLLIDTAIVLLIIFLIFRKYKQTKKNSTTITSPVKSNLVITSKDIRAIAGDDVMVTQLDLARAYIELGKKKLAKQILDHVIKHGNPQQQQAARHLMAGI